MQLPMGKCMTTAEALYEVRQKGMRQCQKATGRHAIAGIGVGAAQMKVKLTPSNREQNHDQHGAHEQRRQSGSAVIHAVKQGAHAA